MESYNNILSYNLHDNLCFILARWHTMWKNYKKKTWPFTNSIRTKKRLGYRNNDKVRWFWSVTKTNGGLSLPPCQNKWITDIYKVIIDLYWKYCVTDKFGYADSVLWLVNYILYNFPFVIIMWTIFSWCKPNFHRIARITSTSIWDLKVDPFDPYDVGLSITYLLQNWLAYMCRLVVVEQWLWNNPLSVRLSSRFSSYVMNSSAIMFPQRISSKKKGHKQRTLFLHQWKKKPQFFQ